MLSNMVWQDHLLSNPVYRSGNAGAHANHLVIDVQHIQDLMLSESLGNSNAH